MPYVSVVSDNGESLCQNDVIRPEIQEQIIVDGLG